MHYTTAAEAVKLIRSNDSVYIQGSTSIPEALVAAMATQTSIPLGAQHGFILILRVSIPL